MLHIPQKWAIIALFLLTLAVGILIGLFIPRPGITPFEDRPFSGPPGPNGRGPNLMGNERLLSKMDVSNQQRQEIRKLTDTYRDSMFNLIHQNRRETMQKVLNLRENLHSDMANVLTEEQFERWQQIYEQNIKKFGPPPHMGPRREGPRRWQNRPGTNSNIKQGQGNRIAPSKQNSGQNQSPQSEQDQ